MALRHWMAGMAAGAALIGSTGSAAACDLEAFGAFEYMAQYDYSAMAEQQKQEAQQKALQEFHDKKMAEAKTAFLSRFKFKTDDGTQVASTGTN